MRMSRSEQLHHRALEHVPAGVHSNSRLRSPFPLFVRQADGAHIEDEDGRVWLDFTMGNGSIVLGHNHPAVQDAVRRSTEQGLTTGYESAAAVETVELMAEMIPDFRAIRFANTGTEAVLHALALARAGTGRKRIAKVEASYHGWGDAVWVSTWPPLDQAGPADAPAAVPGSAGLSRESEDTLVLPFNDIAATTELLDRYGPELAAVILEPVMIDIGYVPASQAYIDAVRELTTAHRIVLIFDEMLTGFRVAPGGARELYGTSPDLGIYGKAIANGYPLAAVEGSRTLLDLSDPTRGGTVGWVGTYNAHAIPLAAARACLLELRSGHVQHRLDDLTSGLQAAASQVASDTGVDAVVSGAGGHFQPYFAPKPPADYREAAASDGGRYRRLVQVCRAEGVLIAETPLGHCALSMAHSEADVHRLLLCLEESLKKTG